MNRNTIIVALVVGLIVSGGFWLMRPDNTTVIKEPGVGALAGPDILSSYISVNGLYTYFNTSDMVTSTTTVCAIQSPAATSTLRHGGALFTTGSTTAAMVTLAKSATAFATTTSLGRHVVTANAQGMVLASTTPTATNLNPDIVFGPSEWFVVGLSGGVGTFSPAGQCNATFEVWQ